MVRALLGLAAVLVFGCFGATGQEDANKPLFDYREEKLDNGLRVVTLEDFSTPIVSVQVWYHVGSKNEDPNRQGFAHMFEHMMFKGTDLVGESDYFDLIRQVGGSANGYTSFDRTVYLETVPASQIELALWLEAERMSFLKVDRQRFNTERRVVEEERRMRLNEPYGTVMEKTLPEVFKVSPYRWAPIGKIPHLRAAKVSELRDFWTKNYVPSNATLIIVGAVKHDKAQELAKKFFGWIPKYPQVKHAVAKEPENTKPEMVTIKEDNAPAPLAGVLFKTAPASSIDDVTLTLLARIMGQGQSCRLYRELVAKNRLAVNVVSEAYSLEREGIFGVGAVMQPFGADPNKVIAILNEQLEKARTEPVSQRELTKAKNQMLKSIVMDTLTIEDKASMLGRAIYDLNDITRVNRLMAEIRAVTADDILAAAKKYLDPSGRIEMRVNRNLVGTVKGAIGAGPDVDGMVAAEGNDVNVPAGRGDVVRPAWWPKTAPVSKELPVPATPKFDEKKLENGLRVIVVPNTEVPFISVQLGNTFGAWAEEKPGSASMAMSMLTRGTKKHTEEQIADELETYAISLGGSADIDSSSVKGNCVKDQLDRMMRIMAEVVTEPNFPADEFGILKQQVMTGLSIRTEEPEYIAEKNFREIFYGKAHPYSRSATGELEDVNRIEIPELARWYKTHISSQHSTIIFAGDIKEEEAYAVTQKYLSNWPMGAKIEMAYPPKVPDVNATKIYLVDNPGVQSRLIVGQKGIVRKDERYFLSRVVNDYFGLGFSSRLNESVRVQKGLTYGIYGGYFAKRFAGEFSINTFTKTEATAQTLAAVMEEVGKLKTIPPTDNDVEKSRSYIVGSFLERRETPQQIADDLWLIISNDLSADYFERMLDTVRKTTSQDCVKLVNETVDPNKMVIVIVGNSAVIKGELEKIGPVEEVRK